MTYGALLAIHVVSGVLALVLGCVALCARKGGKAHRRAGSLFACSMLTMGGTAWALDLARPSTSSNRISALLVGYFVVTGLTAVRRESRLSRFVDAGALAAAVAVAILAAAGGMKAIGRPGPSPSGVPFRYIGGMSLLLSLVLTLAAAGDLRYIRAGKPRGKVRLARHLWRMCFALLIAAGSFFSIKGRVAKILPEPFTSGSWRAMPLVLLFATMLYWLWRVRSVQPATTTRSPSASTALSAE